MRFPESKRNFQNDIKLLLYHMNTELQPEQFGI